MCIVGNLTQCRGPLCRKIRAWVSPADINNVEGNAHLFQLFQYICHALEYSCPSHRIAGLRTNVKTDTVRFESKISCSLEKRYNVFLISTKLLRKTKYTAGVVDTDTRIHSRTRCSRGNFLEL